MYTDFIEKLCACEGLKDVACLGIASQSSLSKWSKEQDAQRAVNGDVFDDFAFHTKSEINPWWELSYEQPVRLKYIIINNRIRNPFDELASDLQVFITTEDKEVISIHAGKLFFGSLPNSLPLILPLKCKYGIKKIKIQILGESFLHLGKIMCLSQIDKDPIFYSNRDDGLGERLKFLLAAIALSREEGGDFRFSWGDIRKDDKEFHAILGVNDFFDYEFVKKHYVSVDTLKKLKLSDISNYQSDGFFIDGILMSDLPKLSKNIFKSSFDLIKFSPAYERIKSIINKNIPMDKKIVAIHLRSGDIVYGQYRFMNRYYSKVLPIYILNFLIDYYKKNSFSIIIFGQDRDFCRDLCKGNSLVYSEDLMEESFDESQKAFFDIYLMSKSSEIIAGHSGFAQIASMIGDAKLVNYKKILSDLSINVRDIECYFTEKYLSNIIKNPLFFAFYLSHFVHSFFDELSIDKRIFYIKKCLEYDIDNYYYLLLLSVLYYQNRDIEKGDLIVKNFMFQKYRNEFYFLVRNKFPDGSNVLLQYIGVFRDAAEAGSLVAAAILMLNDVYYLKSCNFQYYEALCSRYPESLDLAFLKNLMNSLRESMS